MGINSSLAPGELRYGEGRVLEIIETDVIQAIGRYLLLALPATSAETPLPNLRIEPTTGGSIFYLKNVSSQPLTAYIIELVGYPGSSFVFIQDETTSSEAIAPDQEKRIEVSNMTVGAVPDYVKVQAAIYANGATAGVPERISQLLARRRYSLDTIRDLIHRLESAREEKATKEVASASLTSASESMVLPPRAGKMSPLAINQTAGRHLISEAAAYLQMHSVEQTLARLHEWEKFLVESKPPL